MMHDHGEMVDELGDCGEDYDYEFIGSGGNQGPFPPAAASTQAEMDVGGVHNDHMLTGDECDEDDEDGDN